MCPLCVGGILLGEKAMFPIPYSHESEVFFQICESSEIQDLLAICHLVPLSCTCIFILFLWERDIYTNP
jgi:hypothetical protein